MKLPGFKRLLSNDFPQDQRSLIDKLSFSLNNGIEAIYDALNKKLTFKDNFFATEKDIDIIVDSNGTPKNTTFIGTDFGGQVRNVLVGKAENLTVSSNYPTGSVWISWEGTTNGIQVVNVRGLVPNNSYRLRVLMFG